MNAPDKMVVSFKDEISPLIAFVDANLKSAPTAAIGAALRLTTLRILRLDEWGHAVASDPNDPATWLRAIQQKRIEDRSVQLVADEDFERVEAMIKAFMRKS